MKKIILYTFLFLVLALFILSAYKEATSSGAKSTRLSCYKGLTVFEKVHSESLLKKIDKSANKSAEISFVPSKYKSPELFDIVKKEEISLMAQKELNVTFQKKNPLHIKLMVLENDKLDPGKKNEEAKKFLGYIRASYYYENSLIYQVQVDFLTHDKIASTLKCIEQSFGTLLRK